MNVALYIRVSTAEQVEGYSIDEQIDRLNKYADAHGWTVLKTYVDGGYSGANTNRPALQEMIRNIKSFDTVLVYKLDRLSRSQKDALFLIEDVFIKNGVGFVSMSENLDVSSAFGKAILGILASFSQLEREQIRERMSLGKEGRAKKGLWKGGGYAPTGYDYVGGQLVINKPEAYAVREIHRLYANGYSIRKIKKYLDEHNFQSRYGKYNEEQIRKILTGEVYTGKIRHKGKTYDGQHEPIIDQNLFDENQKRYEVRFHTRERSNPTLLGGLIFCKRCGARYAIVGTKNKKYYTCYSRRKINASMVKDPSCKNKIYRMDDLDNMVLSEISKLSTAPIKATERKDRPIKKEIEKIDKQRLRLLDLYATGMYSLEELQKKMQPLIDQKEALQAQLESPRMPQEEAVRAFNSFSDVVKHGDREQLRMLVNSLIDRIEIDGEDVFIHWAF